MEVYISGHGLERTFLADAFNMCSFERDVQRVQKCVGGHGMNSVAEPYTHGQAAVEQER